LDILSLVGGVGLRTALSPEKPRKKITEVAETARPEIHPAKIEAAKPGARLRSARCSGVPIMTELIVLTALFLVAQHLVRFRQLLEFPLRRFVSRIDVGVVSSRQLPVCALDVLVRGTATQANTS